MRAGLAAVWLAAAVVACEHTSPFRPGDYGSDGPLSPGPLARLTYSAGSDRTPAWLTAGAGILYSAERSDRADGDYCLGQLPAGGGSIRRWICRTTASDDSINALDEPAFATDGRLAYVRATAPLTLGRPIAPLAQELVLATLDAPQIVRVLRSIPYTAPSNRVHQAISHVQWLSPTRLAYVGEAVDYPRDCSSCVPDTVRTGLEIITLDFGGATPILALVPGTDSATSVAAGVTGDTIYFTRNGDSHVFRYAFSSSRLDTVYDFAPLQNARDVQVRGNHLYAVLGGRADIGGDLHIVNLVTGTDSGPPLAAGGTLWYQRPTPSPDGQHLVVQARIVDIVLHFSGEILISADTLATASDLWLYRLP